MNANKITIEEIAPGRWSLSGRGFGEVRVDRGPIASIRSVCVCDNRNRYYGRNDHEALLAAYFGEGSS